MARSNTNQVRPSGMSPMLTRLALSRVRRVNYTRVHKSFATFRHAYISVFLKSGWQWLYLVAAVGAVWAGGWARWIGGTLLVWMAFQAARWEGLQEGYTHGYEQAREDAFKEMLRIVKRSSASGPEGSAAP